MDGRQSNSCWGLGGVCVSVGGGGVGWGVYERHGCTDVWKPKDGSGGAVGGIVFLFLQKTKDTLRKLKSQSFLQQKTNSLLLLLVQDHSYIMKQLNALKKK